jgi:hypothetical protein
MLNFLLSKKATKAVTQAVSAIFHRARKRFFNKNAEEKGIRFGVITPQRAVEHREDLSLEGIFNESAKAEGMMPNKRLYESVEDGVSNLLDAHEKLAIARVLNSVQSYLHDADLGSNTANPEKELGKVLGETFEKVTSDVAKVIDTESNKAKNISTLDAISKINLTLGVDDPVVFFAGPVDGHICKNCLKLYFLDDQVTPRVWKSSELKAGYFKKGDATPCIGSLHPNCRHALCSVLLGYGFDKSGKLAFIEPGFDVWASQRK